MSRVDYKTLVVVNPKSSGGGTSRRWRTLAAGLDDVLSNWEHAFTTGPGDATRLVRDALSQGTEMIVAVGGDGTMNEVVNGFFDGDDPVAESPILGLLPSGTGGDFRKTWGLSREPEDALRKLRHGTLRPVDVGRIRWTEGGQEKQRYFANIASFGMSAVVSRKVNESSKLLGGRLSFLKASVRALLEYRRGPVALTLDDGEPTTTDLTVGAVCIGRYFGGGMMVGARAEPGDGLFDVVTMSMTKLDLARMTSIYRGRHLDNPRVDCRRATRVRAEANGDGRVYIEADGEVFGHLPARFELVPAAYRIKV